jgi:hypothetical protein
MLQKTGREFLRQQPSGRVPATAGNPVSGRQNNQGFEGLAMSSDRKTLFILLQSALIQDLDSTSASTIKLTRNNTRLLAYDLRGREPRLAGEHVVQLPLYQDQTTTTKTLLTAAQSELLALNDHQFLVLARDSSVGPTFPATPGSVYRSIDLLEFPARPTLQGPPMTPPLLRSLRKAFSTAPSNLPPIRSSSTSTITPS